MGFPGFAAFKYRIYPNEEQKQLIERTLGCCRFVYNHFLDEALSVYEEEEVFPKKKVHLAALPALKEEKPFLKEVSDYTLESAIDQLAEAEKRFLDEKLDSWLPKRKHKGHGGSFKVGRPRPMKDGKHISVPEYGTFKCVLSRPPEGRIYSGRISLTPSGEYYISLICGFYPKRKRKTAALGGVDVGIGEYFICTSDGYKVPMPEYGREMKKVLRLQRAFSRKLEAKKKAEADPEGFKGSNLTKNRLKIARLHEQMERRRRDMVQKLTTQLVEQYDVIYIEDIAVSKIKEKKNYSRQVTNLLIYEFRRELEYKAAWYGKKVVVLTGENGASAAPHDASVEGAERLLEEGLKRQSL